MNLRGISPSGFVIAGLGFFLTRGTVTLTVTGGTREFVFAGLAPLVLGLGLTILGVALAVGSFEPWYVRTSALWCCLGLGTMIVLVVVSVFGTTNGGIFETVQTRPALSNALLGGAAGGTLTGMYAARTKRQQRAARDRANRLVVLNRILREDVINAVTVIKSHASLVEDHGSEAGDTIADHADRITGTIEEVKCLTQTEIPATAPGPVDVERVVADVVATAEDRHPDADVRVSGTTDATVHANDRLEQALYHLVDNAIVHTDSDVVTIEFETSGNEVRISVRDEGDGLGDRQQRLLEAGDIPTYDDPSTGFGLNVVRLLAESYGARIETDVDDGTTVTLVFPATADGAGADPELTNLESYGVKPQQLVAAAVAALVAGAIMGLVFQWLAGIVPVIGALYGATNPVVGVITHEFHSVVFGLVYAAFLGVAPARWRANLRGYVAVALAWAGFLWLFAAGLVMAAWLRLVGVPAPLPNLTAASLVGHTVWGLTLGAGYYALTAALEGRESAADTPASSQND